MGRVKAEFIDGFYVVGDIAYLPEEWEQRERDVARKRAARLRDQKREHMRRKRHGSEYVRLQIVASLHDLACVGPTRETGCRCKKKLVVRKVEK